jgi:hypothetical protein
MRYRPLPTQTHGEYLPPSPQLRTAVLAGSKLESAISHSGVDTLEYLRQAILPPDLARLVRIG